MAQCRRNGVVNREKKGCNELGDRKCTVEVVTDFELSAGRCGEDADNARTRRNSI